MAGMGMPATGNVARPRTGVATPRPGAPRTGASPGAAVAHVGRPPASNANPPTATLARPTGPNQARRPAPPVTGASGTRSGTAPVGVARSGLSLEAPAPRVAPVATPAPAAARLRYQPDGGPLGRVDRPDGSNLGLFYEKGEREKGRDASELSTIMANGPARSVAPSREFWQQRAGGEVHYGGGHDSWGGHLWNRERDGGSASIRPDGTIDIQNRPKHPLSSVHGKVYERANEDITIAPDGGITLKNLDNGVNTEHEPTGRPVAIGNEHGRYRLSYDAAGGIAGVNPEGDGALPGDLAQVDDRLVLTQREEGGRRIVTEVDAKTGRSQVFRPDAAGSNDAFIDEQRKKLADAGLIPEGATIGQVEDMWQKAMRQRVFAMQGQFATRLNALTDVPHARRNEEFFGFRRQLDSGFKEYEQMMKLAEKGDWRKLDEAFKNSRWAIDPAKVDPSNPATFNPFHGIDQRMRNWTPHPPRFHEIAENFVGGAWDRLAEIPGAIREHPLEAGGLALMTVLAPEVMVPAMLGVGGFKAGWDMGNAGIRIVDGYKRNDPAGVLAGFRELGGTGTDLGMLVGGEMLAGRLQGTRSAGGSKSGPGTARAGGALLREGTAANPRVLQFGNGATKARTAEMAEIAALDARNAIAAGKAAEAARAMNAERAAGIAAIDDPARFMDELRYLSPDKLRQLAEHQPQVVDKFAAALEHQQRTMLGDINEVLAARGLEASGPVKQWKSLLGKLDKDAAENVAKGAKLPDGNPMPATIADMNDLTRARLNTPNLDPAQLRTIVGDLEAHLRRKYPDRDFKLVVKDATDARTMGNPDAMYKGRINVQIHDVTGGVKRGAFELQLGPRHLTEFWDTPFAVSQGGPRLNIHDAVYKGTGRIADDAQFAAIGRHFQPGRALSDADAIAMGRQVVDAANAEYKAQLAAAIDQAQRGTPAFDFQATQTLRLGLARIREALQGQPGVPEGLHGF